MPVHVVRLGTPRVPGEGVRLGTVRYPPRGVPKSELGRRDLYDVWLPILAPSRELLRRFRDAGAGEAAWKALSRGYRKEMEATDPRQVLAALAALSRGASFSVGCYCEEETRCHRSILRDLLSEHGAALG